jgi:DNA-binding transcriptional LysR family regulator
MPTAPPLDLKTCLLAGPPNGGSAILRGSEERMRQKQKIDSIAVLIVRLTRCGSGPNVVCWRVQTRVAPLNRLQSFESFVVSIDAGSISAAAERLGTTKSNVSRRIADLEAHLGVRLLNRNPRKLSATAAGTELYDQLVSLLDGLKEVEERIGAQRTTPRGILRIAAPMSFSTLYLKSLVVSLMKEHPDLVIELDCDDRLSDLQTQGHDCAIRFGQLRDSSLVARKIAPNHHLICASPEYLARKGEPKTPEDLKNHDGLNYSAREPHAMWHLEVNGHKGQRPNAMQQWGSFAGGRA